MITDAQKLEAWKDRMCQKCRCGAKKPQGHSFCATCWAKLPGPLQYALQEHLTKNFNDRYFEALESLKASTQQQALSIPGIQPGEIVRVPTVFTAELREKDGV
jgi:hypothetical protein